MLTGCLAARKRSRAGLQDSIVRCIDSELIELARESTHWNRGSRNRSRDEDSPARTIGDLFSARVSPFKSAKSDSLCRAGEHRLEQLVERLSLVMRSLTNIEFIQQAACDERDTEEVRDRDL